MDVVDRLRQNDPDMQGIKVYVCFQESDADLAQALQQNPFIEEISIIFDRLFETRIDNYPLFRQAIATRENLRVVQLECAGSVAPPPGAPTGVAQAFLEAAHANTAVGEIHLMNFSFVVGSELFTCLCNTTFDDSTTLVLKLCDMADITQRDQAATALAAANIKRLRIGCMVFFDAALLLRLGRCSSLEELQLTHDADPHEIHHFLQHTKTLRRFHCEFFQPRASEARVKEILLSAIKKNFSLRSVTVFFRGQPLFDQEIDQRRLAFYANRNVRLEEWVEKPDLVDRKLWPEALSLAQQAGRDTLYKSLQTVLGKGFVKVKPSSTSGKKRKRTDL